jgi:hypothetical protein
MRLHGEPQERLPQRKKREPQSLGKNFSVVLFFFSAELCGTSSITKSVLEENLVFYYE